MMRVMDRLVRGEASRRKSLAVDAPPGLLAQWLRARLGAPP